MSQLDRKIIHHLVRSELKPFKHTPQSGTVEKGHKWKNIPEEINRQKQDIHFPPCADFSTAIAQNKTSERAYSPPVRFLIQIWDGFKDSSPAFPTQLHEELTGKTTKIRDQSRPKANLRSQG